MRRTLKTLKLPYVDIFNFRDKQPPHTGSPGDFQMPSGHDRCLKLIVSLVNPFLNSTKVCFSGNLSSEFLSWPVQSHFRSRLWLKAFSAAPENPTFTSKLLATEGFYLCRCASRCLDKFWEASSPSQSHSFLLVLPRGKSAIHLWPLYFLSWKLDLPHCLSTIWVDGVGCHTCSPWMAVHESSSPGKGCALQHTTLCRCPLLQKSSLTIVYSQTKWIRYNCQRTATQNLLC